MTENLVRDRATIINTNLGVHEHYGYFRAELFLSFFGGGGISAESGALDDRAPEGSPFGAPRVPTAYMAAVIAAIIRAAGRTDWEDLVGADIVAIRPERGQPVGFASFDGSYEFLYADLLAADA